MLFRFVLLMFFPDVPKLALYFSAAPPNSRLSTITHTGLRLQGTQSKREKKTHTHKSLFKYCRFLLLYSRFLSGLSDEMPSAGTVSGSRAAVRCLGAGLTCNMVRSCQDAWVKLPAQHLLSCTFITTKL